MRYSAVRGFLLLLLLCLPSLAFGASSNVFASPRDTVRLVSASNAATHGAIRLGLQFKLAPGWHIYWSNPGDAGFPPALDPAGPATFSAFRFPPPELLTQGPVTAYVLSGDVLLPFTAQHVAGNVQAAAHWLVCSDVCVPEHAEFTLPLPGGPAAEAALFGPPQIVPSPFPARIAPDGALRVAGIGADRVAAAHFYPAAPGMIANGAPQRLGFTADGLTLHLALQKNAPRLAGVLELTDKSGQMQALRVAPKPDAAPAHPPYLLFAFLGGLILNLMPCVFPILAMKALAIARAGRNLRAEALGYTLGVLGAMAVLAGILLGLRGFGMAAGWGFQFQHPVFVALIAWLFLAAALSLAGVFEVPVPAIFRTLPARGSVATGALAVIVATPCTAPFMGGAVAAALTAPAPYALGIFLALGLGLALPFLLLALLPGLARFLPRPGAWMLRLQRILSLPMLASFAWLAWVLYHQTGPGGLAVLLAGGAILTLALTLPRFRLAGLAALLLLPLLHAAPAPALTLPGAVPYTPARLAALRAAHRPVFVDLTAAWCVTCLVNEATTLKNAAVQSDFTAHHVALLVGDWTDKDAAISALLAAHHRSGVPLYLYYPAAGGAPQILPQILTPGTVEDALGQG
ncbi:MAG: hypothetical protein B7Z81_01785 [Acidocella sp. 20-61-6]|nr:MAG: hypothetical protein B7Z81_01785 [Acidocella sp. 20-61-6]